MSTTTLMPLDPALSPQRLTRILTISADLLPAEIVAARRARRSRSWVGVALVVVLALLAGWYVWADHRVSVAREDLSEVAQQATTLQKSQASYQPVVDVQTQAATITKELKSLLANDLQWANLLNTLRRTASQSGVSLQGINAVLNDATGAASAASADATLPSTTKSAAIGTINLTGGAPDKPSIAKFVDALSRLTSVANTYLTIATTTDKPGATAWQFTVTVDITATTLCGRFTTKCANSGGK